MPKDGAELEDLVAFVERQLVPKGFAVNQRRRIYEDGVQIAELDIVVTGKVGSTDFSWLIECRDRPSEGAAPIDWIEQLVTRRARLGFSKVTAVSTTGFGPAATSFAQRPESRIDLRTVQALVPDEVAHWIEPANATVREWGFENVVCDIWVDPAATPEQRRQAEEVMAIARRDRAPVLRHEQSGEVLNPCRVYINFAMRMEDVKNPLVSGAAPTPFGVEFPCKDELAFLIDTQSGPVRLAALRLNGSISVIETPWPSQALGYEIIGDAGSSKVSQAVRFDPVDVEGKNMLFELHRIEGTNQIIAVLKTEKKN